MRLCGLLVLGCALVLGCGGGGGGGRYTPTPDGGGTASTALIASWSGSISSQPAMCSDGQTVPSQTTAITITIMAGAMNQIFWHANCGDLYLDGNGTTATQSKDLVCPPASQMDGTVVNQTIKNTSLVLNGASLLINYTSSILVSGGPNGPVTCTLAFTGTLNQSKK